MNTCYSSSDLQQPARKKARIKPCTRTYGVGKPYSPLHLDHSDVTLPTPAEFEKMMISVEALTWWKPTDMERQVAWRLIYNDGFRPTDASSRIELAKAVQEKVQIWRDSQEKLKIHMQNLCNIDSDDAESYVDDYDYDDSSSDFEYNYPADEFSDFNNDVSYLID